LNCKSAIKRHQVVARMHGSEFKLHGWKIAYNLTLNRSSK
jgi:hypothetical protein